MSSMIGRTLRGTLSMALVAIMLLGGISTPVSATAQNQVIQSQLTGVSISYGPPYEYQADSSFADENVELLMFVGSTDILAMGFMSPLIDLNGARDIMLETIFGELGSVTTIDRGDYTGVSYSLDMVNIDGQELAAFALFMSQRSHGFSEFYIFIAPPAVFTAAMQSEQAAFTIDGVPLFDGVDAVAMGNLVTANIGVTGGTSVTDVTDVTNESQTTQVNPTVEPVANTNTNAPAADAQAYLDTIVGYQADFRTSFNRFNENAAILADTTATEEQKKVAVNAMVDEAVYWSQANERAKNLTAPAGMEDVEAAYLDWSAEVSLLGMTFMDWVTDSGPTFDDFVAQLDVVNTANKVLADAIAQADAGSANTTTVETAVATEATTNRTGRTTRGTSTQETPEPTEESTGRTSRTTRGKSTQETPEPTEESTGRTSRTTRGTSTEETPESSGRTPRTEVGNSSETQSRTRTANSTTSSASNEWLMELNAVTITWSDAFGLNERVQEPQATNPEANEDKLSLQWNESSGAPIAVAITVFPNEVGDSSNLVSILSTDRDALENIFGANAEVLDAATSPDASAIVIYASDEQGEFFSYIQVTCVAADCATVSLMIITEDGPLLADTVAATQDGVAIDGIPVAGFITGNDVDVLVQDAGN